MADIQLVLTSVPVTFLKGRPSTARAEGNNASWMCACGNELPWLDGVISNLAINATPFAQTATGVIAR